MDSKELRIGNFIRLKENGNIFDVQVVGTRCESIDVYNNGIYTSYLKNIDYYLEPIPLTEEWLLKSGFEETTPKYYVLNIDENISFTYYYTFSGGVWHFEFEGVLIKIEYLHELQNLYFALTKKELPIKK